MPVLQCWVTNRAEPPRKQLLGSAVCVPTHMQLCFLFYLPPALVLLGTHAVYPVSSQTLSDEMVTTCLPWMCHTLQPIVFPSVIYHVVTVAVLSPA